MKTKVEPKLKFEVGEKVVICGADYCFNGCRCFPNTDNFTITTIKEVKEDGSVIVEEGYRYRQAYETTYGELEVFDYFKIARTETVKFNNKEYYRSNRTTKIKDNCTFFGTTYLFKMSKKFEDKMSEFEVLNQERLEDERLEEEARARKEAKEKPWKDAYNKESAPLEEEYWKKKSELWKKYFCVSCKHNHDGYCSQWKHDIESSDVDNCSAWEIK